MGKKGKKRGKKSGKKNGKKKSGEPQMTIREAILAYQINVKEKALEEFMYEINGLEEKRQRNKERNKRLKEEQLYHIRTLLKQAKERDKELEEVTVINKEQVETAFKEKWRACKEEEINIEELKKTIALQTKELEEEVVQVSVWTEYKNKGSRDHATHIKLLEVELDDMQTSFEEMRAHLEKTLKTAKEEIKKSTTERLDEQKYIASEKAMKTLDKFNTQEVIDNDWLKRELDIHRVETRQLVEEVERIERDNLFMMSELFDCRIEDLKISRKFYLTQFEDREDLGDGGILEMDLAKLAVTSPGIATSSQDPTPAPRKQRPKSATQKAIEDKVFSLQPLIGEEPISGDEDDDDEDDDDDFLEGLDSYLNFEDEDFDDYLKLGPLELKLLSVEGHAMPIRHPKKLSDEEANAKLSAPDIWPVTTEMLKSVTSSPVQEAS